jgi:hypothetical protein
MEDNNTTSGAKRAARRSTTSTPAGSFTAGSANDTASGSNAGAYGSGAGGAGRSDTGQGRGIVDRVRQSASSGLSTQKDRATDGLGSVAQAVRQSTQQLRDQNHDTVAQYVEQAADQVERFTNNLRQKDVGEIVNDAQRLARRNPALFIGGAFALGVIGARFLKSSPPDQTRDVYGYGGSREFGNDHPAATGRSVGTITGIARDNPGTESF